MTKEFKTPDKPWLKRLYGDTINPRELIISVAVIVLVIKVFGG